METPRDLEARGFAAAILHDLDQTIDQRLHAAQVLALDAIADEIAALGALIEDLSDKRQATLEKILAEMNKPWPPLDTKNPPM